MNYRKTADILNMTQLGVTQHIHALEREFNCKLFSYNGLTERGKIYREYLQKVKYDEKWLREESSKTRAIFEQLLASFAVSGFAPKHDLYYVFQKASHASVLLYRYLELSKV